MNLFNIAKILKTAVFGCFLMVSGNTVFANQLGAPSPQIARTVVFWDSVPGAESYNIHLADGTYVATTKELRFEALDYFEIAMGGSLHLDLQIVSTNSTGWENWGKSDIVAMRYEASCLGCGGSPVPAEEPSSVDTLASGIQIETYERECFSASVDVHEQRQCTAVCASGSIAVGGSCSIRGTAINLEGQPVVLLGTSTEMGRSSFVCKLPRPGIFLHGVRSTAIVKCMR